MDVLKKFIDELTKHKLLIYFVILWGASMFFWSLYDIGHYAFGYGETLMVLPLFYNLLEVIAGMFLVIFGIKFLKNHIIEVLTKEKTLLLFLLFWAAKFFFEGAYDIIDHGPWIFEYWECLLAFLGGLGGFFAGAVLALFSWNLFSKKEPDTTQ